MQVHDLHPVSERIDEVAAESRQQRDTVLFPQLLAHFRELRFVANDESEVARPVQLNLLDFEHCQKLVLADFEERVALALIEFLETKNVLIKRDRLLDIVDLDGDVVNSVDFDAHGGHDPRGSEKVTSVEAHRMARGFVLGAVATLVGLALCTYLGIEAGAVPANADAKPSRLERWMARTSLRATLDREAPRVSNPVALTDANLFAGIRIYAANCAVCHGAAGGKPSNVARGLYQHPPQLAKDGVEDDPEGVTYWKVDHGIRFTGMPSFGRSLDDEQIWQVTLFLKHMDALPPAAERAWRAVGPTERARARPTTTASR